MAGPPSGSTPIQKVPYPIPNDPVDVPRDIKAVADWLEANFKAAGLAISWVGTVGNGSFTTIDVPHNLHTTNILPIISDVTTGEAEYPRGNILDGDTLRLIFAKPPPTAGKKVVILAGNDTAPPQI